MATSPCNSDDSEVSLATEDGMLTVPSSATPTEAAAIATAVGAHVTDQQKAALAAVTAGNEKSWEGRRWQFAGRTENVSGRTRRVPRTAPTDGWTAAGRLEEL